MINARRWPQEVRCDGNHYGKFWVTQPSSPHYRCAQSYVLPEYRDVVGEAVELHGNAYTGFWFMTRAGVKLDTVFFNWCDISEDV